MRCFYYSGAHTYTLTQVRTYLWNKFYCTFLVESEPTEINATIQTCVRIILNIT